MGKNLYIFNPDHDLAMASNSDHYDAPQSAVQFAKDFSLLPIWYASANSSIWSDSQNQDWLSKQKLQFPTLETIDLYTNNDEIKAVSPWGWNSTLRRSLIANNITSVPELSYIETLRKLSHRELSLKATQKLYAIAPTVLTKPGELLTKEEIESYLKRNPYCIFKAPWSGSGKGICRSLGGLTENLLNRVKKIAEKQGSILAEPLYNVVQDFAMEFLCNNGKATFAGYSWFYTNDNGAYIGNLLTTDYHIEQRLCQWITKTLLENIKQGLLDFLTENVAPYYSGYCGVDMFVHKKDDSLFVHPCVEINMRMTMGLFARLFYDKFVEYGKEGSYFVDYYKDSNALIENDKELSLNKIEIVDGKIQKGYISLTPISANTQYRARVEIT